MSKLTSKQLNTIHDNIMDNPAITGFTTSSTNNGNVYFSDSLHELQAVQRSIRPKLNGNAAPNGKPLICSVNEHPNRPGTYTMSISSGNSNGRSLGNAFGPKQ